MFNAVQLVVIKMHKRYTVMRSGVHLKD